jgi:hypothetical protein
VTGTALQPDIVGGLIQAGRLRYNKAAMANPKHLAILKKGVVAWNEWRKTNPAIAPDFRCARLVTEDLCDADLYRAEFSGACLVGTHFTGANLGCTTLFGTILKDADVRDADFTKAAIAYCAFGNMDLSEAKGLETAKHFAPSALGIDTLYKSKGKIPESFLRGCGVPDSFIRAIPLLLAAAKPIELYSVFISYSSKDDDFVRQLHSRLYADHANVYFAPKDLRSGDKIRPTIHEKIWEHEKLIVVVSRSSLKSEWVESEVAVAMEKERKKKRTVLIPIRLDDAVERVKTGWAVDVRQRQIGDFRTWKTHDAFEQAYARLLRDLQAKPGPPVPVKP